MEWIRVKDRLPEIEDSPILAYFRINEGVYAALKYFDESKGWSGSGWYEMLHEISIEKIEIDLWMPLPSPPKE